MFPNLRGYSPPALSSDPFSRLFSSVLFGRELIRDTLSRFLVLRVVGVSIPLVGLVPFLPTHGPQPPRCGLTFPPFQFRLFDEISKIGFRLKTGFPIFYIPTIPCFPTTGPSSFHPSLFSELRMRNLDPGLAVMTFFPSSFVSIFLSSPSVPIFSSCVLRVRFLHRGSFCCLFPLALKTRWIPSPGIRFREIKKNFTILLTREVLALDFSPFPAFSPPLLCRVALKFPFLSSNFFSLVYPFSLGVKSRFFWSSMRFLSSSLRVCHFSAERRFLLLLGAWTRSGPLVERGILRPSHDRRVTLGLRFFPPLSQKF